MPESALLLIGRVRKAHGIRGEVSVDCYADSPSLLREGVYLQGSSSAPVFREIKTLRVHHGAVLIQFADVADRNAAESLRGLEILIPENRLPEPGDDEIYLHQIMGLSVIQVAEDGAETPLGTISSVTEISGQELWTISSDNEEDVLFPAVSEFVLSFDLEAGIVRIAPPPGLIELYRN